MRRQLVLGAAAVTATIVIAFLVPLAFAVTVLAANRPVNAAEQSARSLATVFALTEDQQVLTDALAAAQAGTPASLTVYRSDGSSAGAGAQRTADVERAFTGAAFIADTPGGRSVFVPASRAEGTVAVVRADLSDALLREGVARSWGLLGLLGVTLIVVSVLAADRLARTVVSPVRTLAATAQTLAGGDLSARVEPAGPPEVVEVGMALNALAARINALLQAEREFLADISHRLRTPLTALRIDAESVPDPRDHERLRADIDAVERTVTELIEEARQPTRSPPTDGVDLVAVARERTAFWAALAEDQQRSWELIVTTPRLPVALHRKDAETLVDVLLDNVFTHTPEGTPYRVVIDAGRLVVIDEGGGFDASAARRGSSAAGSTGLGLDIVRKLAERAGGSLGVTQASPRGACVEVRLPR